ncbi:MAG: class I SAM-dependent methyltransferase [Chloroflexota bacterium]
MARYSAMSSIAERYDRTADAYQRWWGPVLEPTALGVLGLVGPSIPDDGAGIHLLDIGTGTGALAVAAAERWPAIRVTGLDGSAGMLALARRELHRRLGRAADERVEFVTGRAERMPFADASFDIAVSSFVLQLVPHRPRTLAETLRVLRPGGLLGFVTWRASDTPFAPDEALYEVLDELEIDDPEEPEEVRAGDFSSPAAAAAQLRRAGFRDVSAREQVLVHRYDPVTYLDFLEQYAERGRFLGLDDRTAHEVRARTAERLARLPPDAFIWRAPVVSVRARRPPR